MGNNDGGKSSKSDKSSSPAPMDQPNIHVYPDWSAMQACYGTRVTMPPHCNSTVAPGHAPPHYMWVPPQPMIPPYATIYPHGGVNAHPAVPLNIQELKRERRKQSNRESARRSRLRKQADTEELARKVESLTAENATLRSEINQLTEKSEKLRLENATLVEGLKIAELGHEQEINMKKKEDKEGEMYEKKSNSGAELHQLLDSWMRVIELTMWLPAE